MKLTGRELQQKLLERAIRPERIAADFEITVNTVSNWFRQKEVKPMQIFALRGAGFLTPADFGEARRKA